MLNHRKGAAIVRKFVLARIVGGEFALVETDTSYVSLSSIS